MSVKIIFQSFLLLIVAGCTTTKLAYNVNEPVSKLFEANYDQVWKSVMLAMEYYSIEEEDKEQGFLRTEVIKGTNIWSPPFEGKQKKMSIKYVIYIQLIKGMTGFQPVIQVRVLKKIFAQEGFINEPKRIPSNGLEEKVILYRIMREVKIDQYIMDRHRKDNAS